MSRVICWFSCGAASAVATKLAIEQQQTRYPNHSIEVVRIYLKNEHPDSDRFTADCEKWFGVPIRVIQDTKYGADVDTVITTTRYMSGARGARCTKELKKAVRLSYQKPDDVHVFGMHLGEEDRLDGLLDDEPELLLWPVLVESGYDKRMCISAIQEAGIEPPAMYQLGYNNNNCIGCVKAEGAGYWNKIRHDFPDVFARRAEQERMLGNALVTLSIGTVRKRFPELPSRIEAAGREVRYKYAKDGTVLGLRCPLHFLPENVGSKKSILVGNCGFFCEKSPTGVFK